METNHHDDHAQNESSDELTELPGGEVQEQPDHQASQQEPDHDHEEHHGEQRQLAARTFPGKTLLPTPIAGAVSLAARSTAFAIRATTFVGSFGFVAAKFTTLSSLELSRAFFETVLSKAGRDVISRSRTELGRDNAESLLERGLDGIHQALLQAVFWTATGFQATETSITAVSQVSQLLLTVLDQFFGSTDSSRAIASIITLIRREFQNPATGVQGEKVGVMDIVLALAGLAYLQNACRKTIQDEIKNNGQEEIIWDVVVLNDGERVDVHEDSLYGIHRGNYAQRSLRSVRGRDGIIDAIQQHGDHDSADEDDLPEVNLRKQIMSSLPKDTNVSISTSTTTTKIITVEIKGTPDIPILTPPGADMIESEIVNPVNALATGARDTTPIYRVVYRISRNTSRSTAVEQDLEDNDDAKSRVELLDEDEDSSSSEEEEVIEKPLPPPPPPKTPRSTTMPPQITQPSKASDGPKRMPRSVSSTGSTGSNSATSPKDRSSQIPMPKPPPENAANQKRQRQPPSSGAKKPEETPVTPQATNKTASKAAKETDTVGSKPGEKRGGLRNAFKKSSVTGLANLLNKEASNEAVPPTAKNKTGMRPPWGSNKSSQNTHQRNHPSMTPARPAVPNRTPNLVPAREAPRAPQRGNPNYFSSRDLGTLEDNPGHSRSQSRSSFIAVQQRRRNSTVSQTDTFSIQSYESRPGSPTYYRSEFRSSNGPKSKPGNEANELVPPSPQRHPNRSRMGGLYSPSIYTLRASPSQTSLVLSSYHQKSAYSDSEALDTLRRTGTVGGMFPDFHILRNITRYSRYASAAYGSHFLKFMGISKQMPQLKALDETHQDIRSFAHHTELPPDSILLSSYVDPQGGSDSTGSTDTGVPLVHTIAIDEPSKAVVLSCRGTLGFEDVLADMMCEYDDLLWRGKNYKVHKGIHASARRLLYGGDGRVLVTLKETLEEFPDYGLVLCGHSLGGAVTALLGAMLAEPATTGTAFVTSAQQHRRLLTESEGVKSDNAICLPPGRPIHVYAYGPPSTMSPSLQKATRGLITSVVHGNDLVPYLSLGVLHDFQALALAFKTDNSEAKAEVRRRIWEGFQSGVADRWYSNPPKYRDEEDDQWAYAALKTLRATMMSPKLLPPGEVFAIESTPCLRRDAFLHIGEEQIGRPATRLVLKYVRDVESRFREVKFGASMLTDHSPGRYEDALRRLTLGVVDS
ncbi:hypothetical protein PG991_000924 [Apiospora marii]|uniref:sn-1-specific diacylglycerol lipase n=1 Tax=Apiospora marii TaxID=335849 RepID=A0ABR1SVN2_9PEZI